MKESTKDNIIKILAISLAGIYLVRKGRKRGVDLLSGHSIVLGDKKYSINPRSILNAVLPSGGLSSGEMEYLTQGIEKFIRRGKK